MQPHNFHVRTAVVFQTFGNATVKTIVEMGLMKENSVLRRLALTSNLLVRERVRIMAHRNRNFE